MEEIDGILNDTSVEEHGEVEDLPDLAEVMEEDWEDEWNPSAGLWYLAYLYDGLVEAVGEEEADEHLSFLLVEAYKWSHSTSPEEKDVTPDVGTVDAPPSSQIPRGFRGGAGGLTPTQSEAMRRVVAMLADHPPKPVFDCKIEDAVEIWKEAAAKILNKGRGIVVKTDKKTGLPVVEPDFGAVYSMWKNMVEKVVGFRPTREMDKKMEVSVNKARSDAAKKLRSIQRGGHVSAKAAKQASTLMRGAKKKSKKKSEK
jgi:hypothetical protein